MNIYQVNTTWNATRKSLATQQRTVSQACLAVESIMRGLLVVADNRMDAAQIIYKYFNQATATVKAEHRVSVPYGEFTYTLTEYRVLNGRTNTKDGVSDSVTFLFPKTMTPKKLKA